MVNEFIGIYYGHIFVCIYKYVNTVHMYVCWQWLIPSSKYAE